MSQQIQQNAGLHIQRNELLNMLFNINRNLLKKFIFLKDSFTKSQVPNNQISNTFKTWKPVFDQVIQNQFSKISCEAINLNHREFLIHITQKYCYDQQYIEAIKNMNSTTQMIKQFIRMNAIRDPTTNP